MCANNDWPVVCIVGGECKDFGSKHTYGYG